MAQAAAAFGGIEQAQRGETASIGLLIGSRYYRCMLETIPFGTRLSVEARLALARRRGFRRLQLRVERARPAYRRVHAQGLSPARHPAVPAQAGDRRWLTPSSSPDRAAASAAPSRCGSPRPDSRWSLHGRASSPALDATLADLTAAGASAARVLHFDVTDRDAAAAALSADIGAHGAYYGVVCNAGIARDGAFPGADGRGLGPGDRHQPGWFLQRHAAA